MARSESSNWWPCSSVMTLPVTGFTFAGIRPLLNFVGSDKSFAAAGVAGAFRVGADCSIACWVVVVVAIAISPGRITRKGKNIFGIAAINGTRRADSSESEAIAVWITRKSVHQYPKERTNASPIDSPNHSTPNGLLWALVIPRHECVYA